MLKRLCIYFKERWGSMVSLRHDGNYIILEDKDEKKKMLMACLEVEVRICKLLQKSVLEQLS